MPKPLLTVQHAAEFLSVTPRTVRRMIDDGRLPAVRLGRMVRIRPEVLAALVTGQ
jgi:excisionase family DNA binding protein